MSEVAPSASSASAAPASSSSSAPVAASSNRVPADIVDAAAVAAQLEAEEAAFEASQIAAAYEDSELHDSQQQSIASDQSGRPLIGAPAPLRELETEYAANPKFLRKIQAAVTAEPEQTFRRIRGDGNCFYRGYVFGVLCWMSSTLRAEGAASEADKALAASLMATLEGSLDVLLAQGYEKFTMEDFSEAFLELFQWVQKDKPTQQQIVEKLSDEGTDQYMITYARYLTSSYLASHSAEYAPFVPEGRTIDEFRRSEVEPVNHEADYLQIVAFTHVMQVGVQVCYLDQSSGASGSASSASAEDSMHKYTFPEGAQTKVNLLYRPGHYDVLSMPQDK